LAAVFCLEKEGAASVEAASVSCMNLAAKNHPVVLDMPTGVARRPLFQDALICKQAKKEATL